LHTYDRLDNAVRGSVIGMPIEDHSIEYLPGSAREYMISAVASEWYSWSVHISTLRKKGQECIGNLKWRKVSSPRWLRAKEAVAFLALESATTLTAF